MHRFAPVALATLLAASAPALLCAQAPTPFTVPQATGHFTDPANLAGERVRPRDGRELPIDGGLGADGQPDNALGLAQMLRRLSTRASLMLIVAHPDDEDGGMLTYYSRGLGARVAILTLNRGEGGQNQATSDFDDALGLLRTQELLAADRYMGVDTQMFGTEVDFGFTKTKQEAFQKWNHQRVLYDAVRAVRIFRPLIIASTFEGAVTDGHGQHQVSGEIAQEVFKAAGDPSVFPELTKEGILPWQPLKVFARVPFSRVSAQGLYDYATGQTVPAEFTNYVTGQKFTSAPTPDVTINEGQTDPLLTYNATDLADLRTKPSNLNEQLSYVQFARIGLGLQRSQIGGGMRLPRPGRSDVSYHLYGSRVCAPNLPNPTPDLCHSERSAQRAVEEPRGSTTSHNGSTLFNSELSNAASFFNGIDTSVEGIWALAPDAPPTLTAYLHEITDKIGQAERLFDQKNPEACAPPLSDAGELLTKLVFRLKAPTSSDSMKIGSWSKEQRQNVLHEVLVKQVQVNDALVLSLGLHLDATAASDNGDIPVGSAVPVKVTVSTSSHNPEQIVDIQLLNERGENGLPKNTHVDFFARPLSYDGPYRLTISMSPAGTMTLTRPYFSRPNVEQPFYNLNEPALRNASQTPNALVAKTLVAFKNQPGWYVGRTITLERVVHSGSQPVEVIPPVSLTLDRNAQVLPDTTHSLNIDVHTETEDHPQGELLVHAPQDWTIREQQRPLRAGTETFSASLSAHPLTAPSTLKAEAIISGTTYPEGFRAVGYGALPRTNFYTPATLRVVPVDLKLPPPNKRRIAYLPGTGDDVPAALASIGLTPTILKVSDLTPDKLKAFDTVVLGVRTYNAHPDLHGAPTQALFDFARNGGNVVVQYQTNEFSAADAPYPLELHGERVIDETAPVTLLEPEASRYPEASASGLSATSKEKGLQPLGYALLNEPNVITSADFNGWIEERGHGFLDTWDPHYTAPTETHDPGAPAEHIRPQDPQRGGLITVQLGKGRWTYCAFALYRQLPEAVPGAFRLFVNLLNP